MELVTILVALKTAEQCSIYPLSSLFVLAGCGWFNKIFYWIMMTMMITTMPVYWLV